MSTGDRFPFALPLRPLLIVFLVTLLCFAQKVNASQLPSVSSRNSGSPATRAIVGKVIDKRGTIVPGAIVLLKDMKTLQVRSFIGLKDGTYHFFGLSTDIPYEVRAQASGMVSDIKTVSVFDSHNRITVDLKLKEPKKKKHS